MKKPLFIPTSAVLFFLVIFFTAPCLILSSVHEPTSGTGTDDHLKNYIQLDLPGVVGPESFAFDCHGKGPYIGVSDGRILKWHGAQLGWKEFAITSPKRQDLTTMRKTFYKSILLYMFSDINFKGMKPFCMWFSLLLIINYL